MADIYYPGQVPAEYDAQFLSQELSRISATLAALEVSQVIITPVHVEPERLTEGLVANADGTDWNPGSGAGLYEYVSGAWSKL